ncbi:hypothetical protein [Serratia marcescens]|uniref:hypothetical protein n=1 Tax=Serratia marcescens TaxID=615 RepID=UPI00313E146E
MYNKKRMAWRAYKNGYHTGESIKWFSYFHSILTGACFTFFIGLFSAGPDNISSNSSLWWATLGFAISTLLNTCFSLFYLFANDERELIFDIHSYSFTGNLLINTALLLPVISFITLLFYYSTHIGVIILFTIATIFLIINRIFYEIKYSKDKIGKRKAWFIENEKFDDYHKICEEYNFPIFTPEEEMQRTIDFYLHVKVFEIIKKFQNSINQNNNMANIEIFRNELLNVIHNAYNINNSIHGKLLIKIKSLILLTISEDNEMEIDKISEELLKTSLYINSKLDYFK